MTDDIIFHLVTQPEWKAHQDAGLYKPESLEDEGFIHCSNGSQVQEVANRYFKGEKELMLVVIDAASVEADVKMESASDSDEKFPHIKGPLNIDAIIDKIQLLPEDDGTFFIQFETND
ncbi:DUF952 domain-containing protein [Aliifodinibius sp. S!AR15-10]|uniref:DUF952 domain-containing protein n=1 Tax=Aliifodinibius sp. S!AR15-10 TaxID=2950437 RepID=UPI002859F1DF|nr:DUF952 domain-containing protein [Aliifodinibius sp. S!AR15-10]MDR8390941.1 DUF952 domain-containing protein [Aliifodinibius sp. S!AR15-10]